jgi:integrase
MISIYQRGRIWWARGTANGYHLKPRSLDTRFRDVAAKRAAELELNLGKGLETSVKWERFAEEFTRAMESEGLAQGTRVKYSFTLRRFGAFLESQGIMVVNRISRQTVDAYIESRKTDIHPTKKIPVGPEGIKSDLRILRAAFSVALRRGYIAENPVQVRRLNARVRNTQPFSQEEVDRMLAVANEGDGRMRADMKAIILTFLATGFRISDVTGLLKSDVDFSSGHIVRRTKKRGKTVSLELHPELRSSLESPRALTPEQKASPYLFSTKRGERLRNLDGQLRALWRRAGINGAHAHRFRDTFSVRLLGQGATLYDVAQYLGITMAVAERHYAPYVQELRDRGRRLVAGMPISSQTKEVACTTGVQSA